MNKVTSLLLFVILTLSCSQKSSCDQLPKQFATYEEALTQIKSASFKINEDVNTSKSSWIKDATFYSCDGITGFLILKTYKEEYIFNGVEFSVWTAFKKSSSFGSYYNQHIRGKYYFHLTK